MAARWSDWGVGVPVARRAETGGVKEKPLDEEDYLISLEVTSLAAFNTMCEAVVTHLADLDSKEKEEAALKWLGRFVAAAVVRFATAQIAAEESDKAAQASFGCLAAYAISGDDEACASDPVWEAMKTLARLYPISVKIYCSPDALSTGQDGRLRMGVESFVHQAFCYVLKGFAYEAVKDGEACEAKEVPDEIFKEALDTKGRVCVVP